MVGVFTPPCFETGSQCGQASLEHLVNFPVAKITRVITPDMCGDGFMLCTCCVHVPNISHYISFSISSTPQQNCFKKQNQSHPEPGWPSWLKVFSRRPELLPGPHVVEVEYLLGQVVVWSCVAAYLPLPEEQTNKQTSVDKRMEKPVEGLSRTFRRSSSVGWRLGACGAESSEQESGAES